MTNGIFSNSSLSALQETLTFTERRHALLAGNIANLDTPEYKTRDLSVESFQKHLTDAIQIQSRPHFVSPGSAPSSMSGAEATQQAMQRVRDTTQEILFHVGNDVSLEQQVTEIAKNQAMHSMAVSLMRSQFRTMQMAISESVNV